MVSNCYKTSKIGSVHILRSCSRETQFFFFEKWSDKNLEPVNNYLKYLRKEWIDSANNKWYEGAALHVPANDNGIEGKNGSIKGIYTLRERLAVNGYLLNAVTMVRNW
jgi:hypothetical protein